MQEEVRAASEWYIPSEREIHLTEHEKRQRHKKQWHNFWKRACLDVCWKCYDMNGCCTPCNKAKAVLEKKGIKKGI